MSSMPAVLILVGEEEPSMRKLYEYRATPLLFVKGDLCIIIVTIIINLLEAHKQDTS